MKIFTRYHLPTRGTPEVVAIQAGDMHGLLMTALDALVRVQPQVRGAIPEADTAAAIAALRDALNELAGISESAETAPSAETVPSAEVLNLQDALRAANKKWWDLERDYVLPCFPRAEALGIDLPALVRAKAGKNCVMLLLDALEDRVQAATASGRDPRHDLGDF